MVTIAAVALLILFVLYVLFFNLAVNARKRGDMALCLRHGHRAVRMVNPFLLTLGILFIGMVTS